MRQLLTVLIVAGLFMVGCTTAPPDASNPFACKQAPVDMGAAGRIEALSADGLVAVVRVNSETGGMRYDVIDRRWGERYAMKTTGPDGDGAAIRMNETGSLIYGLQYPILEPGELPWFRHDVGSRSTWPLEPAVGEYELPQWFSGDLMRFVAMPAAEVGSPPPNWQIVEFLSGVRRDLGVVTDSTWRTGGFSPDLSLVVQYSAPFSKSKSLRVLDTESGAVVLDFGQVSNENSSFVDTHFIDDRTLLVNDAVPLGSQPDSIPDDGAFLVDIPTGLVTRIDPGIPNASTSWATPDGRRSLFVVIASMETWISVDGANHKLAKTFDAKASSDIKTVVLQDNGRAMLYCF